MLRSPCLPALAVLIAAGCSDPAQIETYSIPARRAVFEGNHVERTKERRVRPVRPAGPMTGGPQTGGNPARMLAALVPVKDGGNTWVFKLTGPAETVNGLVGPFAEFIKSVRIDDSGKPTWTTHVDWKQAADDDPRNDRQTGPVRIRRFATIDVPGGLELSVQDVQFPGGNAEQYKEFVLANINRWRAQLQKLPATADLFVKKELDGTEVHRIPIGGATVYMIGIKGRSTRF